MNDYKVECPNCKFEGNKWDFIDLIPHVLNNDGYMFDDKNYCQVILLACPECGTAFVKK